MRSLVLVALVMVSGCKKEKATAPPAAAQTTDALWKLAPSGATFGAVVSPAGVGRLEAAWFAVKKLIETAPELTDVRATMEAGLAQTLGTSSDATLATLGMTAEKGFALFFANSDRESVVVVLPVTDRDKFLAVMKGQKGSGADTFKALTCKTVQGVYACAKQPALLDQLGKGTLADKLTPVGARGDIEIAGTIPTLPITVAAVVQLERGAFVVRALVKGLPPMVTTLFANAATKPRVEANSVGFASVDLRQWLPNGLPAIEIAPGLTLADLGKTIGGPITINATAGATMFDARVPLSDEAPAKKLIEQCPRVGASQKIQATLDNGVCHLKAPPVEAELDVWVENKELRFGRKAGAPAGPKVEPSKIASELASGEWPFVMYGRGTLAGIGNLAQIAFSTGNMSDKARKGFRMFSTANEVGVAVRPEGDALRVVASVRTIWSNPDDVVAKLAPLPVDELMSKTDVAKKIAAEHPNTPFANDLAAGYIGLMVPTIVIAMAVRVAMPGGAPTSTDDDPSTESEASHQLGRLAKTLQHAYLGAGSFPKGKAPLTPAKACCPKKCADAAAWKQPMWKQLEFTIDEPHFFRYSYESTDGKSFTAMAVGDLDCDKHEITYVLKGAADDKGNVQTSLSKPAPNTD